MSRLVRLTLTFSTFLAILITFLSQSQKAFAYSVLSAEHSQVSIFQDDGDDNCDLCDDLISSSSPFENGDWIVYRDRVINHSLLVSNVFFAEPFFSHSQPIFLIERPPKSAS